MKVIKENLFVKQCKCCGKVFRTDRNKARECDSCLEFKSYNQKAKKKGYKKKAKTKTDFMSISEIVSAIDKYNSKHGTCYTYGQFVEGINNGSIKV